jgi:hypothetical protein
VDTIFGDHYEGETNPRTGEPATLEDVLQELEEGTLWSFEPTGGFQMSAWRDFQEYAFRNGYDAVLAFDTGEGVGKGLDYILNSGDQVKSADANSGAFGPSADILMQEDGAPTFTPEQEAAYAEATAKRDKREAREIVEAVLGIQPKDWGDALEYQGAHTPAGPGSGAPAFDLTYIYPDDVYSSNGVRYYGTGDEKLDRAAFNAVMVLRDKPNAEVTIYRSVPKDSPQTKINAGVWVTTVRAYAKDHGEAPVLMVIALCITAILTLGLFFFNQPVIDLEAQVVGSGQ